MELAEFKPRLLGPSACTLLNPLDSDWGSVSILDAQNLRETGWLRDGYFFLSPLGTRGLWNLRCLFISPFSTKIRVDTVLFATVSPKPRIALAPSRRSIMICLQMSPSRQDLGQVSLSFSFSLSSFAKWPLPYGPRTSDLVAVRIGENSRVSLPAHRPQACLVQTVEVALFSLSLTAPG